ncbi:aldolase fructose-bisphosphate A ALDOA transcript variant X2 mRNA [Crotalus adamanteus]|uniref:Aldolase fructose-bisphosphate A ALDOA transcript variant X2 mRNA n=1 Tax=Crotalus adamanteus TaxID=8729 RepID=A0AAW1B031_CROAD
MPSSNARPKPVFRCFRCNRPGHRAAECTFPESTNIPTGVGRPGTTPKKMTEKSRVAHQVGQTAPGDISPALEEYEEEGPVEDPMKGALARHGSSGGGLLTGKRQRLEEGYKKREQSLGGAGLTFSPIPDLLSSRLNIGPGT